MKSLQEHAGWEYETVTALAYRLCLEEGCQPGDALRYWHEAELWLRYRDVDPVDLEARLTKVPCPSLTPPGRPEELRFKLGARFFFRQASVALPAAKAAHATALGEWRLRGGRPGKSGARRVRFRTHV